MLYHLPYFFTPNLLSPQKSSTSHISQERNVFSVIISDPTYKEGCYPIFKMNALNNSSEVLLRTVRF